MAKKDLQIKEKGKGLWSEFKKFITRGNVLDLAVGVIIGGAFGAIVTALVNILMSLCTFAIPSGINGLVSVLPAVSPSQHAPNGYNDIIDVVTYLSLTGAEQGIYVQHGAKYYYKGLAIVDWGALVNAVVSFVIIALTLFVIIKVAAGVAKKRDELKAKMVEEYYEKHPEKRPVPPVPGVPEPTTNDLLKEIRDLLSKEK